MGSLQQEIGGPGSYSYYSKGLVRLDLKSNGAQPAEVCSAVLVGPNLLLTAAHCVHNKTIDGVSQWSGTKYGKVRVRMVYKPSASEVMCLNETCRNSDGTKRYSTVYAFWAGTYAGTGDTSSDFAVLTRISQADFLTKAPDPGDPPPRNFINDDFLRIMADTLPTNNIWYMQVNGYGALSDTQTSVVPRRGAMHVDDWNTHTMVASYDNGWATPCKSDSGGPLTIKPTTNGRTYLGGLTLGSMDAVNGSCPEPGDDIAFNRVHSKIWMINTIRQWVENDSCAQYTTSVLPNGGEYHKCW